MSLVQTFADWIFDATSIAFGNLLAERQPDGTWSVYQTLEGRHATRLNSDLKREDAIRWAYDLAKKAKAEASGP